MINKKISDINTSDIQNLIDNQILENKTLEYKSILPGSTPDDKEEFLADVSSFANSDGGDIVYGIKQNKDTIEKDFGLNISNTDNEIQRLENLVRDGISPRIDCEMISIKINDQKYILIIRIRPNLNSPHRVIFRGLNKFFKRNSNGKYELDVNELRTDFINSSNIINKVRDFRKSRFYDIKSGNLPVTIPQPERFLAIHIVPLSSMFNANQISNEQLIEIKNRKIELGPLDAYGNSVRINLDGACAYNLSSGETTNYTQIFRDGKIEGLNTRIIREYEQGNEIIKEIPMIYIEKLVINYIIKNINLLKNLQLTPPYYVFITLSGVKDYGISLPQDYFHDGEQIKDNDIFLPEVIINSVDEDVAKILKPIFDMVWNAAGYDKSYGYDDKGELIKI